MCRRPRSLPARESERLERVLAERASRPDAAWARLSERVRLLRAIDLDLRLAAHGLVVHDRRTGIDSFYSGGASADRLVARAAMQALRLRVQVERERDLAERSYLRSA